MKLGHVHLKVRDLDEAVQFYRKVFHLRVEEETGRYVFLSGNDEHHMVALQKVHGDPVTSSDRPGLYHVAFEVEDRSVLRDIYQRVQNRVDQVSPVDHGISQSIYFEDPSGNGIEVYVDTRDVTGQTRWNGQNQPLSLSDSERD